MSADNPVGHPKIPPQLPGTFILLCPPKHTWYIMLYMRKSTSGFTLVELALVIGIIAILAVLVVGSYRGTTLRANDAKRMSDAKAIMDGLSTFRAKNTVFPSYNNCGGCSNDTGGTPDLFLNLIGSVTNNTQFKGPTSASSDVYWYHYEATPGLFGCPVANGKFYILWIQGMQTQTAAKIDAPDCPGQTLFTPTYVPGVSYGVTAKDLIYFRFD